MSTKQQGAHNKHQYYWLLGGGGVAAALAALAIGYVLNDDTSSSAVVWSGEYDPLFGIGANACSIERRREEDLSAADFLEQYWRVKPIILRRFASTNRAAQQRTTKQRLLATFGTQPIRLATYESYAFHAKEQQKTLRDYLEQLEAVSVAHHHNTPANTSFAFGSDPYQVGNDYVVPRVVSELKHQHRLLLVDDEWHFQVAVAASGAGLAFHWHADVFAETLHGRRRWFLVAPDESPIFHPRETSAKWLARRLLPHYNITTRRTTTTTTTKTYNNTRNMVQECTIGANEVIYVPADWFHATLSLGEAVSITTSFAQTFRKDFRESRNATMENGSILHIQMLDALGERDYAGAIAFAERLAESRPNNFVPHGWLGIIRTLYIQSLADSPNTPYVLQHSQQAGLETHIVETLQAARASTKTCTELNPLYAPCLVWLARQCRALAKLTKDPVASKMLLAEAKESQRTAFLMGSEDDDEMLDPRWRPKNGASQTA